MKSKIATLFILVLAFTLHAQNTSRNLEKFTEVNISGGINVELISGSQHKAEIEVTKGSVENLKTEISGNRLKIYFSNKSGNSNGNNKANIKLYYSTLQAVQAAAGANVKSHNTIKAGDFEASASSGGKLSLSVDASNINAEVSSGGRAELEGSSKYLKIAASSGGNFEGSDLKCDKVKAKASSGGQANIWVTKSLDAKANSGGGVKYKGNPSDLEIDSGKYSGGYVKKI